MAEPAAPRSAKRTTKIAAKIAAATVVLTGLLRANRPGPTVLGTSVSPLRLGIATKTAGTRVRDPEPRAAPAPLLLLLVRIIATVATTTIPTAEDRNAGSPPGATSKVAGPMLGDFKYCEQ